MCDGDLPSPSAPFTRGCKSRASLPVGRSGGHTGERPRGVLYLQYGEETKQVRMPPELSSQDSLHALFVTAFPHQLTMKMLQSHNLVIYIKDTSRNFYYELDDIRNISPHSCLKVYHKDPAHIFNRHARPAKTEGRISKEILYGSHSPVHSRSSPGRSTLQNLQGSMSPPMVRSMPSSPSRRAYGGGSSGVVAGDLGSSTLPRERLSGAGLSRSLCTNSSSSILERRDVKPDEDADNIKSMALVLRGEGSSHYPDSYSSSLQDGGGPVGRISISSSQCSAPPSLTSDILDSLGTGITGGLQQFRASVKPLMGYGDALDQQTRSLHRQKSRKFGESQLPPLGTRTPPSSPQRVNEVRLTEGQIIGGVGLVSGDRMSPIRRSLRRDSNGTAEVVNKSRGSGSTSSSSSVFFDSPLGTPDRLFQGHVTASAVQSERMKAMEEQIASLAGLVHHALSVGVEIPGMKDAVSESSGQKLLNSRLGVSPDHHKPAALTDSSKAPPLALQAPPLDSELQQSLMLARRNVSELRAQLKQLRHQQLLNQQSVNSMLQMAGQELLLLMCERVNQSEEAAFRRRAGMEEERMLYMRTEEAILNQLSELEVYVDHLQRSSASSPGQMTITLRDVEEAAVNLRRVGEALSVLKSEFPELQVKLRSVLRLEVEAVRFLKEEPHKMDVMLRRVRSLTEALSSLRRSVSESGPLTKPGQEDTPLKEAEQGVLRSSPKPQPRSSVKAPPPTEVCLDGSASPLMVRRMKSAAATGVQPPHHHHPSPPLTPTHGRDSPTVAKVSPRSREGSPALQRKPGPGTGPGPGLEDNKDQVNLKPKPKHTETAQRQPPEGGTTTETSSINHMTTRSGSSQSSSTDQQKGGSSKDKPSGRGPSESEQSAPKNKSDEASEKQEVTAYRLSEDAGSSHISTAHTDSAPAPSAAPSAAPSSSERSSRPLVEKPRRSSVERELKQSPDRAGRSPPPPPPRRFHSANSSVSRASSEEEKLTRREPLGAQDEDDKDKKPSTAPQPKPPRQPPEVKPKPVLAAPSPSPPAAASTHRHEVEEEKEGKKVTKELQVTTNLSDKNRLSKKNKKWKEVIPQKPSDLQVAPQVSSSQSCTHREENAERHKEEPKRKEAGKLEQQEASVRGAAVEEVWVLRNDALQSPQTVQTKKKDEKKNSTAPQEGKTVQKEESQAQRTATPTGRLMENSSSHGQVRGQLKEAPLPAAPPEVLTAQPRATPQDQQKESPPQKVPGQVCSPTTGEKKVKFTTIVTLQKDVSLTEAEQTKEKAAGDAPAEKKSNLMVVLTLQKENTADDGSAEASPQEQQEERRSPEPPPVLKRYPPSPDLTFTEQQRQDDAERRSRSQCSEDGGTLSPDMCDDEGPPPPPPPTGKISLRLSRSRAWTPPKEEDQNRSAESVDSSSETTYLGHVNQEFEDGEPIIFILNEPMDFEYAYKRLSTIFESEEELERILSSENLLVEEELQGQDQNIRKINISDLNSCLKDMTGNGHPHKPPADKGSTPENQEKSPDPLKKTENKKKFKFKFPKNKLAAISQALRSGSTKAGKKTLEVVVYEEVEETGTATETIEQTKESIINAKQSHEGENKKCDGDIKDSTPVRTINSKSQSRAEELRKSALDSVDSLEQSIKLLEISVDSITAPSPPRSPEESSASKDKVKRERERSPSKRPAPQVLKGPNPPQSKRARAPPPPEAGRASTKKQTSSTSSSSAQRLHTKSRHSPSSGSEKTTKNQPANQKQPGQPHVVTIPR